MKSISPALLAHKKGRVTTLCEILRVGPCRDGVVYGFSGSSSDITYDAGDGIGPILYRARTGFSGSASLSTSDLSVDNAEAMTLIAEYPVPGVTQAAIDRGYFDGAPFVVFHVNHADLSMGHEELSAGNIGEQRVNYGMIAILEQRSFSQQMKSPVGELYSVTCRCKQFGSQIGDERFPCLYNIASEWVAFTVDNVGDEASRQFNASALVQAEKFFAPGVVEWLTGANAGDEMEVEASGPTLPRYHLLLHCDGANGSTVITDETGKIGTPNAGAQISTAWQKFGTGSLALDGFGDYVNFPDSPDWAFGTGAFTIQCFARFRVASASAGLIAQWGGTTAARAWVFYLNAGSLFMRFSEPSTGTLRDVSVPFVPVPLQVYHFAATRDAFGMVRIFIDGIVSASGSRPQAVNDGTAGLRVGGVGGLTSTYDFDGWIDEVAVTKGAAHYTANFTPPAAPLALRTGGDVTLLFTMEEPISAGDTGRIRRDCTREFIGHNSCETYHGTSRGARFRGEPFTPVGDPLQIPGANT